jgi:integrase
VKAYCARRAIHPLVATFLLTGGRKAEVLGLEVKDVSFDRKTVTFRPNERRSLKTRTSHRTVPLWPQLEEILRPYVFSATAPRGEGLLFPSDRGGGMIWDLRKALDAIARSAGWEAGEIRTRVFRHTYCATRLQTLDRGAPVSPWVVSREMGHGGRSLVDRVYGHLGDVRHRSETVEFRVEQHREQLDERAKKVAHLSL